MPLSATVVNKFMIFREESQQAVLRQEPKVIRGTETLVSYPVWTQPASLRNTDKMRRTNQLL